MERVENNMEEIYLQIQLKKCEESVIHFEFNWKEYKEKYIIKQFLKANIINVS